MVCAFARDELLGGVTTIRTVGGLSTFDTRLRDEIRAGRRVGPRILAANEGISVPGGHMAGSVAIAAETIDQALAQVDAVHAQGADLVKLMITGGVMDAKERGVPGELKMPPEMVRAVCERAHALGYTVAAHTESPGGRARGAGKRRGLHRARREAGRRDPAACFTSGARFCARRSRPRCRTRALTARSRT